jgi:hypothetical protein
MRTGRLLEPLRHGLPFVVAPVKPALLAHVRPPRKIGRDTNGEKCGVEAGYDKSILERGAG